MVIEFLDFRSIAGTAHLREKFPEKWKNFQREIERYRNKVIIMLLLRTLTLKTKEANT